MGVTGSPDCITFTAGSISLNRSTTITKPTTIYGNLNVTGKVTSNGSNTITHYSPVEASEDISSFKVGTPCFISGHAYKRVLAENDIAKWISSSANDTTDCICSVKTSGTYKEFIGIVTKIDVENNCITFATHGDFLFSVDDTTTGLC